jgi:hypothetical protein
VTCFSLFFSAKSENRRVEQVLPRWEGWHQWKGGGGGERREEGEYGANCVYICMKCKSDNLLKLFHKWGGDKGEQFVFEYHGYDTL